MLTIRHIRDGRATTVPRSGLAAAMEASGYVWVDLAAPTDDEEAVLDELDVPPLAVEDMREDRHLPRSELIGDVLSLTVHGIHLAVADVEVSTTELDLALTPGLVVTFHESPLASLDAVGGGLDRGTAGRLGRPVELVHLLLDTLNDVFVPFLDLIERRMNVIEEDLLTDPTEATRRDIYALQRDLVALRRVLVPQAEMLRRLGRDRRGPLQAGDEALFRDLYDDGHRLAELTESYRQLVDGAMTSYRSALDDRLNSMLTTLTLVSAVLLPISVIAGLWGTNFAVLPGTATAAGFWILLAASLAIVVVMVAWFRLKGWIGRDAERAAMERRRSHLGAVLDVPLLGQVLKVPVRGARSVLETARHPRER